MEQIICGGTHRYLSELPEFKDGLPHGVVNKTKTDVGGTYIAANCESNYIIVCPFRDLVDSIVADKNNKYPIIKCYGGVSESQFKKDLKTNKVKKIAVTYDSLPKLMSWIGDLSSYKLLIDEYHLLLESVDFRTNAITNLMNMISCFSHYTFLTATPPEAQFEIQQLKELPHYTVTWDSLTKIKPYRYKASSVAKGIAKFIQIFMEQGIRLPDIDGNITDVKHLFIYINSVTTAEQICRTLDLSQDDVKICCANRQRNRLLLNKYQIEPVSNPNKKINFFTSKGFQGCNLYTNNGLVIVGSDGRREQTLIDISTTLEQIAGRIRLSNDSQNVFRHILVHIYSTNNHIMTDEEFNSFIEDLSHEAQKIKSGFSKMDEEERAAISKKVQWETTLLSYEDGKLEMNELKRMNFIYKQHLRTVYRDGFAVRQAYAQSKKFELTNQETMKELDIVMKRALTVGYQELIKDYFENPSDDYDLEYPEFRSYKKYLTIQEIHSMSYNKEKLMKAVEDKRNLYQVFRTIHREGFVSRNELRQLFKAEFDKRGIKLSPKATLVEQCPFYDASKESPYINGKRTSGYILGPIKLDFRL